MYLAVMASRNFSGYCCVYLELGIVRLLQSVVEAYQEEAQGVRRFLFEVWPSVAAERSLQNHSRRRTQSGQSTLYLQSHVIHHQVAPPQVLPYFRLEYRPKPIVEFVSPLYCMTFRNQTAIGIH